MYDKNEARRNNLVKDLNSYDIIKFITNSQTPEKPIDIEKVKKWETDVYKNFPNMEWFREFRDLVNDSKTNWFLAEWNKKIEDKTTVKEVEVKENKLFTADEILNKYNWEKKDSIINFNKNNPGSKFMDVYKILSDDSKVLDNNDNLKKVTTLFNKWDLKWFQREVYWSNLKDSEFKDDWMFWPETLKAVQRYL